MDNELLEQIFGTQAASTSGGMNYSMFSGTDTTVRIDPGCGCTTHSTLMVTDYGAPYRELFIEIYPDGIDNGGEPAVTWLTEDGLRALRDVIDKKLAEPEEYARKHPLDGFESS